MVCGNNDLNNLYLIDADSISILEIDRISQQCSNPNELLAIEVVLRRTNR